MRLRVVGLSATPGSSPESVQEVIRNLGVSRVEFRNEDDPDVSPYCHKKQVHRGLGAAPQLPVPGRSGRAVRVVWDDAGSCIISEKVYRGQVGCNCHCTAFKL